MSNNINIQSQGSDEVLKLYESRHKKGDVVAEHYHRIPQILFILEGKGEIQIDGDTHQLEQNSVVVIAPYAVHTIKSEDKAFTLLVLAFEVNKLNINFDGDFPADLLSSSLCMKLNHFTANETAHLLRKIMFEQSSVNPMSHIAIPLFLMNLLLIIARGSQLTSSADSNTLRAKRISDYIHTHYYEQLNANLIGERMGISARYVNSLFKNEFGMTPMHYLTKFRIEVAQKMLAETDKAIVLIGFEVGYENVSTFYRNFLKVAQMSPHQYRVLHQTSSEL